MTEPRRMTVAEILIWADAYRDRHGKWPRIGSGPIPEAPGATWSRVQGALMRGSCGIPAASSLARLLKRERAAAEPKGYRPVYR